MEMRMAPLTCCGKKTNALHVKRALEEAGIEAHVYAPGDAPAGWELRQLGGVSVWVAETQVAEALALLQLLPKRADVYGE
jgi:uncharacterized NAD-dependent epimerase/dehydratase family protein